MTGVIKITRAIEYQEPAWPNFLLERREPGCRQYGPNFEAPKIPLGELTEAHIDELCASLKAHWWRLKNPQPLLTEGE